MTRPASRRTFIRNGLLTAAVFTAAGAAGAELISRGTLPGRTVLDELDGACSVPAPPVPPGTPGPSLSGTFYSAARRRAVGYTIAYPPAGSGGHGYRGRRQRLLEPAPRRRSDGDGDR
jgi:hypothetical protein